MLKNSSFPRQNYTLILDNIDDAVIAVDQSGRITLLNPAAQVLTSKSEKQALGQSFFSIFEQQETLCYLTRTTLDEGRSISAREIPLAGHNHQDKRLVSATVSPILPSKGAQQGAVVILRDLTQIRALEEAINHADRLSVVGTMAAGLAHEIKNPLGGIKGAAQLLQLELDNDSDLLENTKLIIREAERINRIIEELLNLSSPRKIKTGQVNLSQLLDEVVSLLQHSFCNCGLRIKFRPDLSIPEIPGDKDLLIRLFLNLIKNACEASPERTEILVESRIGAKYHLSLPGDRPIPMVQVSIHDHGVGISENDLKKIFTPFYTTKSGGSGLGLAICQKIVSDHEGLLHFEKPESGGTRVDVSLPLRRNNL